MSPETTASTETTETKTPVAKPTKKPTAKKTAKRTAKPAAKTKAKGNARGARTAAPDGKWREKAIKETATIKVVAENNPYRGARAQRWVYKNGMKVAAALEKGARLPDIKWDLAKGYITVH